MLSLEVTLWLETSLHVLRDRKYSSLHPLSEISFGHLFRNNVFSVKILVFNIHTLVWRRPALKPLKHCAEAHVTASKTTQPFSSCLPPLPKVKPPCHQSTPLHFLSTVPSSFQLPSPHPCVGKCWLTVDRINSLGLEASFWRAVTLPVIHFSAGTNPCSYTQHAVTVGTTSPAPFHWKTSTLTPLHSCWPVKSKEGLCLDHNNFETHCVFMAVGLFVFLF